MKERERARTLSTQWNYVGMETVSAEREVWRWLHVTGAPRHPDEVDEPFRETFRGLPPLPNWVKGRLGV